MRHCVANRGICCASGSRPGTARSPRRPGANNSGSVHWPGTYSCEFCPHVWSRPSVQERFQRARDVAGGESVHLDRSCTQWLWHLHDTIARVNRYCMYDVSKQAPHPLSCQWYAGASCRANSPALPPPHGRSSVHADMQIYGDFMSIGGIESIDAEVAAVKASKG